jgi:hypothetical protein
MARPTTVRSAAGILDLSERQVQRLIQEGALGCTRKPTPKERAATSNAGARATASRR